MINIMLTKMNKLLNNINNKYSMLLEKIIIINKSANR